MKLQINPRELLIPVAIVFAGLILAGTVYAVRIRHTITTAAVDSSIVRPVTPTDHIVGNPSAAITIIEYADIDSSYSKQFQLTMEQVMTEYAADGKVAWVYRHFPVTSLHPAAATNALAAECAASLTTPATFFTFIDAMESASPNENEFDPNNYTALLPQFNIDATAFKKCVTDGTFTKRIHDDYDNALAAGATASPFVLLVVHGQKPTPITGALPYTTMKKIIDQALAQTTP